MLGTGGQFNFRTKGRQAEASWIFSVASRTKVRGPGFVGR